MRSATLLTAALLLSAFQALAVPPPPGMFDAPSERHLDWVFSYADAMERGVDAPNGFYGRHNPVVRAMGDDQMNVLILLVDFSDNQAQTPSVYFDSMGFAQDTFSLKRYYFDVSFGQIDVVTVDWPSSTGWNRVSQEYGYYVNNNYGWGSYPQNSQGLVEEVCELVDPYIDFTQYDNDQDGYVDGVNLMYAGQFTGNPDTIWPHMWCLPGGGVEFDGVTVYAFSVQNEYNNSPGDKSAAVFCHEFGHVMGLPDLYDYDYDSKGIGNWGIMAGGVYNGGGWSPAEFSPYCRHELGTTEYIDITTPGTYQVPAYELSNVAYRLWTGGSPNYQYFLLENRRQIRWDEHLPSQGVLIWHVDETQSGNDNQWYPGYTSYGHYLVALEQADGQWHLEQNTNGGDAGDPFPGSTSNTEFSWCSTPDSRSYTGADTQVFVSEIPVSADTVEVYISTTYSGIEGGDVTSPVISPFPGGIMVNHPGGNAVIAVHDIVGRRVETLFQGDLSAGSHSFTIPAGTLPSGVFLVSYTAGSLMGSVKVVSF